ncbi:MAG: hypothetical protein ACTHMM_06725 [Agriterribacter sp.]
MKKAVITAAVAICVWACNEPASTGTPATDSLHNDNINQSDVNNRNTTKYDSANAGAGADTASYDRMKRKSVDSMPKQ